MSDVVEFTRRGGNGGRGGPCNEWGLTKREEDFCQRVALGTSYSDAYRAAYDASNMDNSTVWNRAWSVAHRSRVEARVKTLTEEVSETEKIRGLRAKAFIEERLWTEALSEKSKPGERLKALELLGKLEHVAAFKERTEVTDGAATPEEIKSRIEELLAKAS